MRILLLSQTFYPDVVATAQYVSDLAVELAARGHDVTVIASSRNYDNPAQRFPAREIWHGVHVHRVPVSPLGRKGKLRRIISAMSYIASSAVPMFTQKRWDAIVVVSTPPVLVTLAAVMKKIRGGHLVYWVHDMNPDQAIAANWINSGSLVARILESFSLFSLRTSSKLVVLDRFMQQRILDKGIEKHKICIIPPWSHDQTITFDAERRLAFRKSMNWQNKFVVMYAGNHSPLHPLDNLLEAALQLRNDPSIHFVFSGGGNALPPIRQFAIDHELTNVEIIGYRPIEELSDLLSSCDLQVVAMGEPFVGIVHPCKIYNMLAIGKPILYIGPEQSHIEDMRNSSNIDAMTHSVRHGDAATTIDIIRNLSAAFHADGEPEPFPHDVLAAFSQRKLMDEMVAVITTGH